jgi:transcriptional regulator with XRE-family HTH domain
MFDLQQYRKIKKLTQKQIQDVTGLDQSVISKYESGKLTSVHVSNILIKHYPDLIDYTIEESETIDYLQKVIDQQSVLIENLTIIVKTNSNQADTIFFQSKTIEHLTKKLFNPYQEKEGDISIASEPD